jgi:hypothetical protein
MPSAYLGFHCSDIDHLVNRLLRRRQDEPVLAEVGSPKPHQVSAFQAGFCAAIAKGIPLRAIEAMTYLGTGTECSTSVRQHQFRLDRGGTLTLQLPSDARMYIFTEEDEQLPGAAYIRPGICFGRAMGKLPEPEWRDLPLPRQWATLPEVCGSRPQMMLLQRLWLTQQAIVLPGLPDLMLFPSSLVLPVCTHVRPVSLWWDFHRCHPQMSDRSIYVFDPIPLERWDKLRLTVGGEIDVDAGIGDSRFIGRRPRHTPRRTPRILPAAA